jgi:NADH-quinone oxidoreductase subunit E
MTWIAEAEDRMALTQEEIQQIEAEVSSYPQKRAACVEALRIVQRRCGWISDENLRQIADLLAMTPDELDGVATFYSMIFREPVGKHVILICDCVTCWIMGYESLLDHLKRLLGIGLGEMTEDGRFTLLPVACLGACDRAPVMMVDGELYTDLSVDQVDEILNRYE